MPVSCAVPVSVLHHPVRTAPALCCGGTAAFHSRAATRRTCYVLYIAHFGTKTGNRTVWLGWAYFSACFEVMGNVCAIRAHTQEPCSNDQTLQILPAALASEDNCRKSRRSRFFPLASSLIFEMPLSGGSAKKRLKVVLIFWCLLHGVFFRKNILRSKEDFRVVTFS